MGTAGEAGRSFLVAIALVAVVSGAPITDIPALLDFRDPGSPTTEPCVFRVTQGSLDYVVLPVVGASTVNAFYSYSSASAHTPFVEAYASVLFLYLNTATGTMHLVFHFNIDEGGSPDADTMVSLAGIPAGAGVTLSDDPSEFDLSRSPPQGRFNYFENTDGGVLGPLPTATDWTITAGLTHAGPDPMRSQKWVDGDGTRLALGLTGAIAIRGECNAAPLAEAGGPYNGFEGSPITFDGGGSSDPDGSPLSYVWDFENDGIDDLTTTSPTTPHAYPDDFSGKAKLTVSDGVETATDFASVTVANVAPILSATPLGSPGIEGTPGVEVLLSVTDPGIDNVRVTFDWGDGLGPRLVDVVFHPMGLELRELNTYGDDGTYPLAIVATDDDGGVGRVDGILLTAENTAPTILLFTAPATIAEGSMAEVHVEARDAGSDDLSVAVDFGNGQSETAMRFNGAGPDPDPSPLGTWPFFAVATFTARYVRDGTYTVRVVVSDDDGGSIEASSAIVVLNVAPTILRFGPGSAIEGSPGSLTATASDPGEDPLTFLWTFELGPTHTEEFPATGSPMTATSTANFRYGDDGSYVVRLTVADDDASTTFETTVEVANAAPHAELLQVTRPGTLSLRVAGEKWHDVAATFFRDDGTLASLSITRTPGSPDDQTLSTDSMDFAVGSRFSARILYTPDDDPVNGQPNGANPVWILIESPDDEPIRVHHTFNVQQEGTYVWEVDLTPYMALLGIRFEASAEDPGSDDLTFAWDFGDGASVITTYFNDGAGSDLAKSPSGTSPFHAADAVAHGFPGPGTYTVVLTVTDDDGGTTSATYAITILG